MVIIRLHIYFTDCFFLGGLSFNNSEIIIIIYFVITKTKRGLIVFEIMKTKTPEFTVKFDLKLGGKNWTEDNLTD